MQVHTEACKANTEKWQAAKEEFVKRHPDYCTMCNGFGGKWYSYDPSPAGVSLSAGSMSDFDPCVYCLDDMRCPHCGGDLGESEGSLGLFCMNLECGWNEEVEDGIPDEPECICPYEEYEAVFPEFDFLTD